MANVYLALGSNIGDREKNLHEAVREINKRIGEVFSLSAFYVTTPWGFVSKNEFLNAACVLRTEFSPQQVLVLTQQIERELGRTHKSDGQHYADRSIDIDILLYDDLILCTPELTIPHPLMEERAFVLKPLTEIAPDVLHPIRHQTVRELWQKLVQSP